MKGLSSDIDEHEHFGAVQWVHLFVQFNDYSNYFKNYNR